MHVDTGHNFPEVIEFRDRRMDALGERLIVASVRSRSTRGGSSTRPGRARRATSCRRRRCSTRSRSTASTRRWAARAATRKRARAKERTSCFRDDSRTSGTRARSSPGALEPLQRADPLVASMMRALFRPRTGRSSTSGSTSGCERPRAAATIFFAHEARGVPPRRDARRRQRATSSSVSRRRTSLFMRVGAGPGRSAR